MMAEWPRNAFAVVNNVSIAMFYKFLAKTMLHLLQNETTESVGATVRI